MLLIAQVIYSIDKCICNSRAPVIQVFEKGDPSSKLHWRQPCPVCSKDAMEVKEHLVPNIRPPAKLAVGKHAITHTFSYTPVSGSLKETKCFANISVKGMCTFILCTSHKHSNLSRFYASRQVNQLHWQAWNVFISLCKTKVNFVYKWMFYICEEEEINLFVVSKKYTKISGVSFHWENPTAIC